MRDTLITLAARFLSFVFPTTNPLSPARAAFRKILIVKPCCLGDVILATPVISALRRAFPGAQIDFAVGAWSRVVVEHHPHVGGIIDSGRVGQGQYGWRDVWRLAQELRANDYGLCVTLDRSPRVGLVAWLAGIPLRVGLNSKGRGFAHNVRVPVPSIRYEPELYLDAARALIAQTGRAQFEFEPTLFAPTDEERRQVEGVGASSRLLVAIHPGGGSNPGTLLAAKRWNPERFAAIADRLIAEYGATVILIGAKSDAEITRAVCAAMTRQPVDLTGQLSIGQLGALYQKCALMIGNDSGVMHLANAVGTPTVALYGPSDPRVYGPYNRKSLALWHEVGCNPCFKHGHARADCCPKRAIEAITVDEVWEAAQIVLRRQGVSKPDAS